MREGRKSKIDRIMSFIQERERFKSGMPIDLWVTGGLRGSPGEPEFERWMQGCTLMVDAILDITKEKDTDSCFFAFVRQYGRREY